MNFDMIFLRRPLVLVLMLLLGFFAMNELGYRKLANPDEGRYSEIAREMAATGDFVTPRLNGLKYFEKPPMQYWATAAAFSAFGESEFSARLYTFLCGIACLLLIAYTGSRLFDQETGALSVLVLMAAPYFMMLSAIVTLDMGLTFWMTLGVCSFMLAQTTSSPRECRRWMLLAWAGMAGAVLSKGLIGVVFPAATIFLYCLLARDFRLLLKLEWLRGLALFFAIAVPWFALVSLRNPEFAHFFFIHEHFERFLTTSHRREAAWWFFVPIVFAGFLPWMIALLPATISGWRSPALPGADGSTFAPLKFMLLFCAFVLLFFSKSSSKLPAYILPMFPLLAMVIAVYLKKTKARTLSWLLFPLPPLALAGAYAAWIAPAQRFGDDFARQQLYAEMSIWVVAAALLIASGTLAAFFALRNGRKWLGIVVVSASILGTVALIQRGYENISPLQSGHATAASIGKHLTPDTRLYAVRIYDQSLPYYLKRVFTLVNYVDEFEMGQKAEPQKYIAQLADFPAAWNAAGPAIAIIQPGDIESIRALGIAFEVIHQDAKRVAIKKI